MALSHAEYFLKETIKLHGNGLFNYAKNNYTKHGRGTVLFHFTPIGSEFECEDAIYLNITDTINKSESIFGKNPENTMMRSLIEKYEPNYEFICCIIVSFPNNTNDMRFAKCDTRNNFFS